MNKRVFSGVLHNGIAVRRTGGGACCEITLFGNLVVSKLLHSAQEMGKGLRERWAVGKEEWGSGHSKKAYIRLGPG